MGCIDYNETDGPSGCKVVNHNHMLIAYFGGDVGFRFLPYQLRTVGYWPTITLTGNGNAVVNYRVLTKGADSDVEFARRRKRALPHDSRTV